MMSKRKWLAGMLAAAFAVGSIAPAVSAESLWKNPSGYPTRNVFADHRAMNVGDIVTIIISETTTTSATRSSANEKSGSVSIGAGVGIFDFLKAASASGSDKFNAKGSASSTNRTIGNVTVTITEITPAGNFILEGTQSICRTAMSTRSRSAACAARRTSPQRTPCSRHALPMRRYASTARDRSMQNSGRAF